MTAPIPADGSSGQRRGRWSRRGVLLTAWVAALLAAFAAGWFFGEPPRVMEDAQAAAFADGGLLTAISTVASRATDPAATAAVALQSGLVANRVNEDPYRWAVLTTSDRTVTVATYYRWGTDPLAVGLSGAPPWGRACRSYEVDAGPVRARAVECPLGTPDEPPL